MIVWSNSVLVGLGVCLWTLGHHTVIYSLWLRTVWSSYNSLPTHRSQPSWHLGACYDLEPQWSLKVLCWWLGPRVVWLQDILRGLMCPGWQCSRGMSWNLQKVRLTGGRTLLGGLEGCHWSRSTQLFFLCFLGVASEGQPASRSWYQAFLTIMDSIPLELWAKTVSLKVSSSGGFITEEITTVPGSGVLETQMLWEKKGSQGLTHQQRNPSVGFGTLFKKWALFISQRSQLRDLPCHPQPNPIIFCLTLEPLWLGHANTGGQLCNCGLTSERTFSGILLQCWKTITKLIL